MQIYSTKLLFVKIRQRSNNICRTFLVANFYERKLLCKSLELYWNISGMFLQSAISDNFSPLQETTSLFRCVFVDTFSYTIKHCQLFSKFKLVSTNAVLFFSSFSWSNQLNFVNVFFNH